MAYSSRAQPCPRSNASVLGRLASSTHRKDRCSVVWDPIQWLWATCGWVFLEVVFSLMEACGSQQQLHGDGLHQEHCMRCGQRIWSVVPSPCCSITNCACETTQAHPLLNHSLCKSKKNRQQYTRKKLIVRKVGGISNIHLSFWCKMVKVAHTQLPSVGFWSWSQFLAVSLQVTRVINPAVVCHYFPLGLQLPRNPKRAATNFATWWTEAQWV